MHGDDNCELDTILQESKNCHLYEKMGYRQTGKLLPVRFSLIFESISISLPIPVYFVL
jgi:hypothetical protein